MHSCPGPWAEACLVPVSHDLEAEDLPVELSGPATLTNVQSVYLCLVLAVDTGSSEKKEKYLTTVGFEPGTSHLERRQLYHFTT